MSDLFLAAADAGPSLPKGAVPLCFTWEAHERLRREFSSVDAWEELIPAEEGEPLMARTLDLAASWNLDGRNDVTEFDGYSLAGLYRWLLWLRTIHPAYKFATALSRAVDRHRPSTVYCETAVPRLYREALDCTAGPLGLRVVPVESNARPADNWEWTLPSLVPPRSKRLAGRLLNAASGRGADDQSELLLTYYPSLEPVVAGARARGASVAFADIPPARRLPSLAGKASVWLEPASPPQRSAQDDEALSKMILRWDRLRESPEFRSRFDWKGISLRPVVEPVLDAIVRRQFLPWRWACRQLNQRWTKTPPGALLVPFPGPPYQQALQMTARRHGTPSAVLLHGLPASYSFPFEKPQNGTFLVWGTEQEKLYTENSAPLSFRMMLTGNPNFDRYAGRLRARTGEIKRILLLTHPVAQSTPLSSDLDPARYAVRAAAALSAHPKFEVTLRLHPSESVDYYRKLISPILPLAKVVKGGPVVESLESCDLVVGSFSTVLMEAMLLGLPVAALNFSRDAFPPPFDGRWGIPLLRTPEELDKLLRDAARDPETFRRELCARHEEVLERFAGRVDGHAAERVAEALASLATGVKTS